MKITIPIKNSYFNAIFVMNNHQFENPIVIDKISKDGTILIIFNEDNEIPRFYKLNYKNHCIQHGFEKLNEDEMINALNLFELNRYH